MGYTPVVTFYEKRDKVERNFPLGRDRGVTLGGRANASSYSKSLPLFTILYGNGLFMLNGAILF